MVGAFVRVAPPPLSSLITRSICLIPSVHTIDWFSHQEVIGMSFS